MPPLPGARTQRRRREARRSPGPAALLALLLPAVVAAATMAAADAAPRLPGRSALRPTRADLAKLIRRLPKAELHIHVEGTLEPELMMDLAAKNGVKLPFPNAAAARAARANFTCLQDFLDLYDASTAVLLTEGDFHALAAAYLRRAEAENIAVAEIFVDAQGHMARGVPLPALVAGLSRAISESPVEASLVLCIQRQLGPTEALELLDAARPFVVAEKRRAFIALGMAGSELGHPPAEFVRAFAEAGPLGLHKTAHAGEEGGPEYVSDAIRLLGVERVDHGIRSLEDPGLVALMAKRRIPITLCPISNLRLQVYKGQLEARIRQMLGSGIMVTINSDDPAYFGSYVNGNYEWVAGVAGLGPDDLAQLAANSFEASFLPPAAKHKYVGKVWKALKDWERKQHGAQQGADAASAPGQSVTQQ